jgi:2-haloacid dehalogenase
MMTSQKITTIIFDFGGVLVDWNPRNLYQHYFPEQPQAMEDFLTEIKFMEWNALQDKGRTFAEGAAILSGEFPQYADLIHAYHENWEKSIIGQIDESVEILIALKKKGFPIYGLSNWSAETFPLARQRYKVFELLDDYVLSGDVRLIKPGVEIFEYCLKKIGKTAQECLFIDDSEANIITAKQLGFDTIHFTSPAQLKSEISARHLL